MKGQDSGTRAKEFAAVMVFVKGLIALACFGLFGVITVLYNGPGI